VTAWTGLTVYQDAYLDLYIVSSLNKQSTVIDLC
jgi:hypothetical protein